MVTILLTRDLLFGSKIAVAASSAGCTLREVATMDALCEAVEQSDPVDCVIIDLTCPGVGERLVDSVAAMRLRNESLTIIAYGPHVQTARLEMAVQAECDHVLTRGQLHRNLSTLFSRSDA